MQSIAARLRRWPGEQPLLFLPLAGVLWLALYQSLAPAAATLVAALPVAPDSLLGGAL